MRDEYDFSKAERNPYAKKLKQQITINIDSDTIAYFKEQSDANGIPYQTLINLYLSCCVKEKKEAAAVVGVIHESHESMMPLPVQYNLGPRLVPFPLMTPRSP